MSRLRRSMLYLPGNNPNMVQDAHLYGSDSILIDLEDSVVISEKDAARDLVRKALDNIDYGDLEVTIRINPVYTDFYEDDLKAIVPGKPDAIRIPKSESAEQIKKVDQFISKLEKENGIEVGSIKLMPMIESAQGVRAVHEIAEASERNVALTIGGEDLATDLGVTRTKGSEEIFTARSLVVLAAKAAGIDALDTVYSNVNDLEGLKKETELIKKLGFAGKAVIHPKQIKPVHQVFNPTAAEIREARKVVDAAEEAERKGQGAITVNGKMVDYPIVDRARKTIAYAESTAK